MVDLNRATGISPELSVTIDDAFEYHRWTQEQIEKGDLVRDALKNAFKAILIFVPPGPDRSVALRKIREARMDCNSAITHGGKY